MIRLFVLSLFVFLFSTEVFAEDNHQVGVKFGLTSIDNEDGWHLENGTVFVDFLYDTPTVIDPRFDFGYIAIDKDENNGVGSLLQFAINGIYDFDMSRFNNSIKPYLLTGLGYEHVSDKTDSFESHMFGQIGFGLHYALWDDISFVSEFKALKIFDDDNSDEDNEFTILFGFSVPLYVNVISGEIDQKSEFEKLPISKSAVAEPIVEFFQEETIINNENIVVIPEEVSYTEDAQVVIPVAKVTKKSRVFTKVKRQKLNINFETNSHQIQSSSKSLVKQYARFLNANPNIKITIEGYTDSSGLRNKNIILSQKRASTVVELLKQYGVKGWRLNAVGKGDFNPIADNHTPEGRAKNRRIEAVIKD